MSSGGGEPAGSCKAGTGARFRRRPVVYACAAAAALALGVAAPPAGAFEAGAGSADITPPAYTVASDAAFVPACGTSAAQVSELWPGPRRFAFEKPYRDLYGLGRYAPGDPYCESDGSGRYEAPYIAGGSGQNRWPESAETGNGPAAQAVVMGAANSRVALVSVDSIGLFDSTIERIRTEVHRQDPTLGAIFVSSTHDESAPDPIGLWGPDASELPGEAETPAAVSSGVDEYYMSFLVERVAGAVVAADAARRPARLAAAIGSMPSNTQSCWSSYPYIDDQSLPVMQARDRRGGGVIFTLADVSTHAETLAFSGVGEYRARLSADWPGKMRAALEQRWPGSVGIEVAGLVGSVETPTVYEPESTQVTRVPGQIHGVPGNPDGCSSVYPQPASGTPVSNAEEFLGAYGQSVADGVSAALEGARNFTPASLQAQQQPVCMELENNFFKAAFGAHLFPDRPLYADPNCTVAAGTEQPQQGGSGAQPAGGDEPGWLKSAVGVLSLGPVQLAYSPGEVFPVTEIRGPLDEAQMPFPTDCYEPLTQNFDCGEPLPMTSWISAEMTARYRFLVGLGEDMVGYLFPPGNFVGDEGESVKQPWASYEETNQNGGHDRFGYGHADDAESLGPYAGLDMTDAVSGLLAGDGRPSDVVPGLYVDASGHLSDSPFASGSFGGAVGVEILAAGAKKPKTLKVGNGAGRWATFDGQPDPGTAGTSLRYSVRTAGVMRGGRPLLIDVYAGSAALGG